LSSEVVRRAWSGCVQPVVLYRIVGGGHTWPGSRFEVARLGATTKQIDAAQTMWDFFAADAGG
jgi:polyhydroxybutyrate depolymerase